MSGYFEHDAGDGYSPTTLYRVLDTRKGIGAPMAKVAANSGIPVTIAGVDSIPAGVRAVAVHITVADTTGTGWVAAEPDGAGIPGTSSLNYVPKQSVSNTVIVPVAADGKIELYNGGGATPVSLIADVSGYFAADAPDAYVPIDPTRVVDTRLTIWAAPIPGGATKTLLLSTEESSGLNLDLPADAIVAANATATNTKGTGYVTIYPAGTSRPATSSLNFTAGQVVAGFGLLNTSGPDQEVDVCNVSTGNVDMVFDVFGYFTNS